MKEVLIILDGLMEKSLEGIDLKQLILGEIDINYKINETDFSVKGKDIDSLNCIMNMLGYSPLEYDISDRAYYEGLSRGIVNYKYILRCNVIKVENNILKDFTGGVLPKNIGDKLKGIEIENGYIHPCYEYKNLLVINSIKEDVKNTEFYPPHFHIEENINNILPNNKYIISIINNSYEYFKDNALNGLMLWPWGVSKNIDLKSFKEKYNKKAGIVSGIDLVYGIGLALGMNSVKPLNSTGDDNTNLENKLSSSLKLLNKADLLIIHINGFDELSHRKDFNGKLEFIKKVQSKFLIPLINNLRDFNNVNITITCDHRSDSFTGSHEKGGVPVIKIEV